MESRVQNIWRKSQIFLILFPKMIFAVLKGTSMVSVTLIDALLTSVWSLLRAAVIRVLFSLNSASSHSPKSWDCTSLPEKNRGKRRNQKRRLRSFFQFHFFFNIYFYMHRCFICKYVCVRVSDLRVTVRSCQVLGMKRR